MKINYPTPIGTYPGHRISLKDKQAHLYHYTTFDSFVRIWLYQRLLFSPLSKMNDLQEKSVRSSSCSVNCFQLLSAYDKIRRDYKQISLTMDYDSYIKGCMSPVMWGHYADKCNGVCIELDPLKLSFPKNSLHRPIHYITTLDHFTSIPSNIKGIGDIDLFIHKNARRILFTKQAGWRQENEYRIVSKDDDYLDITGAVTAIYLTSCQSKECLMVEKLVDGTVPVKLFYYKRALNNKSIPVIIGTKEKREQLEKELRPLEEIEAEERKIEQVVTNRLKAISEK